jgi:hypothetical protein
MAPNLKQATANRRATKAAKAVAEKLTASATGVQDSKASANSNSPAITTSSATTNQLISASIAVPGLSRLTTDYFSGPD